MISTKQALNLTRIAQKLLQNAETNQEIENPQEGLDYYEKVIHDLEILEILRHNIVIEKTPYTGECYLYSTNSGSIPREVYDKLKEWIDAENAHPSW